MANLLGRFVTEGVDIMLKIIGVLLVVASMLSLVALALSPGFGYAGQPNSDVPLQGPERLSPADRIDSSQIAVTAQGVLVRGLRDVRLVNLADSNSMDPVLDAEATAIEIIPSRADELHVGDIVSYRSGRDTIIHRIIEIGDDGEWYAVVKGDNNAVADPSVVRFEQVKGVVVGILY